MVMVMVVVVMVLVMMVMVIVMMVMVIVTASRRMIVTASRRTPRRGAIQKYPAGLGLAELPCRARGPSLLPGALGRSAWAPGLSAVGAPAKAAVVAE